MPLCWIFLLKRRRALSNVSFSPTRTSANPVITSHGRESSRRRVGRATERASRQAGDAPAVKGRRSLAEATAPVNRAGRVGPLLNSRGDPRPLARIPAPLVSIALRGRSPAFTRLCGAMAIRSRSRYPSDGQSWADSGTRWDARLADRALGAQT